MSSYTMWSITAVLLTGLPCLSTPCPQCGFDFMYIPLPVLGMLMFLKVTFLTQFVSALGGTEPMEAPKPVRTMFSTNIFCVQPPH